MFQKVNFLFFGIENISCFCYPFVPFLQLLKWKRDIVNNWMQKNISRLFSCAKKTHCLAFMVLRLDLEFLIRLEFQYHWKLGSDVLWGLYLTRHSNWKSVPDTVLTSPIGRIEGSGSKKNFNLLLLNGWIMESVIREQHLGLRLNRWCHESDFDVIMFVKSGWKVIPSEWFLKTSRDLLWRRDWNDKIQSDFLAPKKLEF